MKHLKYYDHINEAIIRATKKFGEEAVIEYLSSYLTSMKKHKVFSELVKKRLYEKN